MVPSAQSGSWRLLGLHTVLLLVTIAPILSVEIPALGDYPNHLARLHILANIDRVPALAENYRVVPTLTPYLLVDWMLTPLVRIWGAYEVGRAFVAATMALTYGGALALSVTLFRRLTPWPALVLPLLYNLALSWGFMNFNFGVAVMFWSIVAWLWLGHRSIWLRSPLLFTLSALLYLTHMLAFGLFVVVVASHGLAAAWRHQGRRMAAIAGEFAIVAPPFLLTLVVCFVWFSSEGVAGEYVTRYGSLIDKAAVLLSPTAFTDSIADGVALLIYGMGGLYLLRRGALGLSSGMRLPLLALGLVCLAIPNTLFGVWGVDFRLPPVLLMLTVAATQPTAVLAGGRPVFAGAVAALILFRAATVGYELRVVDQQFHEFRTVAGGIDEGAKVLVSHDLVGGRLTLPVRAYLHLPTVLTIERAAFLPQLFTGITQIRSAPRNADLDAGVSSTLRSEDIAMGLDSNFIAANRNRVLNAYDRIYWAGWDRNFDFMVRINPVPMDGDVAARLGPVSRHSFFEIARILRAP